QTGCGFEHQFAAITRALGVDGRAAPESAAPGTPSKPDFVGWTGLPPIAVLLEYVLGLRPDAPARRLLWDVRLTDAHGVRRYRWAATSRSILPAPRGARPPTR